MNLDRIANAVRSMITRGKVTGATLGPRTLLQVTGLDGEVFEGVELLVPPGYFALPAVGSDVVIKNVNGTRDHKIATGGDTLADRQADLQPGDRGVCRGAARVIFKSNMTVVQDPVQIVLMAPELFWSPDGGATLIKLATAEHTHGGVQTGGGFTETPGPNPQVTG